MGRGAFAAGLIALGCITPAVPGALGASVEFKGELNYDAFKRASDKGVGIRITQSPGGTGAAAMVLGRAKGLVIDGVCNSACAWALSSQTCRLENMRMKTGALAECIEMDMVSPGVGCRP